MNSFLEHKIFFTVRGAFTIKLLVSGIQCKSELTKEIYENKLEEIAVTFGVAAVTITLDRSSPYWQQCNERLV